MISLNLLISQGVRESAINRAEGIRQSKILASEAMRIEEVNKAKGQLNVHWANCIYNKVHPTISIALQ